MIKRTVFEKIEHYCQRLIADGHFALDPDNVQQEQIVWSTSLSDLSDVEHYSNSESQHALALFQELPSNDINKIPYDTILSIFRSCYKSYMKSHSKHFKTDPATVKRYYNEWKVGQCSLLSMAQRMKIPPMRLAKSIAQLVWREANFCNLIGTKSTSKDPQQQSSPKKFQLKVLLLLLKIYHACR